MDIATLGTLAGILLAIGSLYWIVRQDRTALVRSAVESAQIAARAEVSIANLDEQISHLLATQTANERENSASRKRLYDEVADLRKDMVRDFRELTEVVTTARVDIAAISQGMNGS